MCRLSVLVVLIASFLCAVSSVVNADTGVSDGRVSLPDGPGSVGGAGENQTASGNMAAMVYEVPFELPPGFVGATPRLGLSYSSMNGSGEVGIGWELSVPHIERFTLRGVPGYDHGDVFAADGSDELVRVSSAGGLHVYRARFEHDFVRYTWHADAQGRAGHWETEYRDGSRGFFGADAQGNPVPGARVTDPASGGVFRYLLVETLDPSGHSVRYHYTEQWGDYPLLSEVEYVFLHGRPRYRVRLSYEAWPEGVSSALSGVELRLKARLSGVSVLSSEAILRRYALQYEDSAVGISHLSAVEHFGADGTSSPIRLSFSYSAELELDCEDCSRPFVYDMGQLEAGSSGGVELKRKLSTLIDINGDALPDLLDTGLDGHHRFFLNTMAADGSQHFAAPRPSAQTRAGSNFVLDAPGVQAVDVNGDGLTDLIDAVSGEKLCNLAQGDWSAGDTCGALSLAAQLSEDPADAGQTDPRGMRFMDYDGDKRIDLLHTTELGASQVWHNTPGGFVVKSVQALGKVFDDNSSLELGEMNGDGLLDPVEVSPSGNLWYRINLGLGRWSEPRQQVLTDAPTALEDAEFADLNGDGLDDLVVVRADTVSFALNHLGTMLPFQTLDSATVEGFLPTFDHATMSVLFADMNGSGTTDVVWVAADGSVRVLELFALRPNLLTRIDNGLGGVRTIEYGTSAREQARDTALGQLWRTRLPQPMNLVTAITRYTEDTPEVRHQIRYSYHHGLYDGIEKRYRGFAQVQEFSAASPAQQASQVVFDYDLGTDDSYFSGKLLREQHFGGDREVRIPLRQVVHQYADCPVSEVPTQGLRERVRHICENLTETVLQEGRPEHEWVTLRSERQQDGYGRVTLAVERGVIGLGRNGQLACGPCTAPDGTVSGACGSECLGDEEFVETEYPAPGDTQPWILELPVRVLAYGEPGGPRAETRHYYDGAPFVGLPSARYTRGLRTRTCQRVTVEAAEDCEGEGWAQSLRVERDLHGHVVSELDPLGDSGRLDGHRRRFEYDHWGLAITGVELLLAADGNPYRLRREVIYGPLWHEAAAVTPWLLQGAPVSSLRVETRYGYDAFGRRNQIWQPGAAPGAPTETFAYELAKPLRRIVVQGRSGQSTEPDLETLRCLDGWGLPSQTRTRVSDGVYRVSGFQEVNPVGLPVRAYQAYLGGRDCELRPPEGVAFSSYHYDALGRLVSITAPDSELYGEASVSSVAHLPLLTVSSDEEDTDSSSPHFGTPTRRTTDGLRRLVRLERGLDHGGGVGGITVLWDSLGRLAGYLDPGGNLKSQRHDLLGRVTQVRDPNAGTTRLTYDAAGNVLSRTDARGIRLENRYDGLNRNVAHFDAADPERTRVATRYDFDSECSHCEHAAGKPVRSAYPLGGSRGVGLDALGYDPRGRRVHFSRTLEGHSFEITTKYDDASRPVETRFPDGAVLRHNYDPASQLIAVGGAADRVEYDPSGNVASIALANGLFSQRDHDVLGRLEAVRAVGADFTTLQGQTFERDRVGNILRIRDDSDVRVNRPRWDASFQYDAWYRPVRVRFDSNGIQAREVRYDYDTLDNIVLASSGSEPSYDAHLGPYAYSEDHPNRLLSAGPLSVGYNAAGGMTEVGGNEIERDHLNRVISVPGAGAGEFVYGPGGERVMKIENGSVAYYMGDQFEVRDGISQVHALVGSDIAATRSSLNLATKILPNLGKAASAALPDVGDAWIASRRSRADAARYLWHSARRLLMRGASEWTYFHSDALGNRTLSTDSKGRVQGEKAYFEAGAIRFETGHIGTRGFGGRERDASTGWIHFPFRDLDPRTGRWVTPDPLFAIATEAGLARLGESTTGYAFVANNLFNSVDPTGLVRWKSARSALRQQAHVIGPRAAALLRPIGNFAIRSGAVRAGFEAGTRLVSAMESGGWNPAIVAAVGTAVIRLATLGAVKAVYDAMVDVHGLPAALDEVLTRETQEAQAAAIDLMRRTPALQGSRHVIAEFLGDPYPSLSPLEGD